MVEMKASYPIVVVTHNLPEAARVSDDTAFLLGSADGVGRLVEFGPLRRSFCRACDDRRNQPRKPETADQVSGHIG